MSENVIQAYGQAVLLLRDALFLDGHDLIPADTVFFEPYRNSAVIGHNAGRVIGFLHRRARSTVDTAYAIRIANIISGHFTDRIQFQLSAALEYNLLGVQHLDGLRINGRFRLNLHIALINIDICRDHFILSGFFFHIVHDLVIQDLLVAAVLCPLQAGQCDLVALDRTSHDIDSFLPVFFQAGTGRITDTYLIHRIEDLSGILRADIALPCHSVDDVLSHKAKRTDGIPILSPDHGLFSGIQVPHIQITVIDIVPFLPYDDLMILRYLKTVILPDAYQLLCASVLQIHIIDTVFEEKVQMLLPVPVQKLAHLVFQHRITLGIWNIDLFLDGVQRIVVT